MSQAGHDAVDPEQKHLPVAPAYIPQLPAELDKNLSLVVNLGLSGHSLAALPAGVGVQPPPAADAITYPTDPAGIAIIKVANSCDYQIQDMNKGIPIGGLKTRAEFSTMRLISTRYGEGDCFVYRIAVRLHSGWHWSERIAIILQFKRMPGRPDMFLGVKRRHIVLRIGPHGLPYESQTTIVPNVALEKWTEVVLSVNWSTSSTGKVSPYWRYADAPGYHEGRAIVGQNLQEPSRSSYAKFGIYKPDNFSSDLPPTAAQSLDLGNVAIFAPSAC